MENIRTKIQLAVEGGREVGKLSDQINNLGKDLNAHEDSFLFTQMLNLEVDYLFEESKDHDLVRAIYEDCEYKGKEFNGINSLKKYNEYPRHNGRF